MSIGIVADDGREFYAQSVETYPDNQFVYDHVWPKMQNLEWWHSREGHQFPWLDHAQMQRGIVDFLGEDPSVEFWGDYAAFDYVVLSMLLGEFDDWPSGWPMHINDLQQLPGGREASDSVASLIPHNALSDARAVKAAYDLATEVQP